MQELQQATSDLRRSCKMRIEKITNPSGEIEDVVFIDNEDGGYTSMPKSVYDEQQANAPTAFPHLP